MALNEQYFDSLNLEIVKKKYYNANKVEAILQDIWQQVELLSTENERLRAQLDELNGQKDEISSAVLSAQTVYNTTVVRARKQAAVIIDEANAQREAILSGAAKQQEYAVRNVSECFNRVKKEYEACIEAINDNWQDFLRGLPTEGDCQVPDLEQKVGAIASELFSIDKEN